jgi:hypothetical protein
LLEHDVAAETQVLAEVSQSECVLSEHSAFDAFVEQEVKPEQVRNGAYSIFFEITPPFPLP